MPPLLTLTAGMIVVLAGILLFRMHAFLALLAGALTVTLMTTRQQVFDAQLLGKAPEVISVSADSASLEVAVPRGQTLKAGRHYVYRYHSAHGVWQQVGRVVLDRQDEPGRARVVGDGRRSRLPLRALGGTSLAHGYSPRALQQVHREVGVRPGFRFLSSFFRVIPPCHAAGRILACSERRIRFRALSGLGVRKNRRMRFGMHTYSKTSNPKWPTVVSSPSRNGL